MASESEQQEITHLMGLRFPSLGVALHIAQDGIITLARSMPSLTHSAAPPLPQNAGVLGTPIKFSRGLLLSFPTLLTTLEIA